MKSTSIIISLCAVGQNSQGNRPRPIWRDRQITDRLARSADLNSTQIDELRDYIESRSANRGASGLSAARAAASMINREPGVRAMAMPNTFINLLEQSVVRTGNATEKSLVAMQRAVATAAQPLEDARTLALTARDLALANRLTARASAVDPLVNLAQEVNNNIDNMVDTLDARMSESLFAPMTITLSAISRARRRFQDIPAHTAIFAGCLASPECCLNPEECSEI